MRLIALVLLCTVTACSNPASSEPAASSVEAKFALHCKGSYVVKSNGTMMTNEPSAPTPYQQVIAIDTDTKTIKIKDTNPCFKGDKCNFTSDDTRIDFTTHGEKTYAENPDGLSVVDQTVSIDRVAGTVENTMAVKTTQRSGVYSATTSTFSGTCEKVALDFKLPDPKPKF